jgi:site-specific DNA recombinase
MERGLISERTRTALRHKKAHSAVYSRITPLGFTREGDKLIANDAEMETVRTIQRMRSEGLSMKRIADALNAAGAATKLGGTWRQATIDKVLRIHDKAKAVAAA